uniref:DUF668 domain-containing protein n=1 Tax=Oryza punctata TaxID=4537 RepID=A0A0E0MJL7_ORYPU
MRKLSVPRGGGERRVVVGPVAFEVAALMSRAAGLWRALGDAEVARLRGDRVRLEGVRLLVADDDAPLMSLALAEMAAACRDLSRSVARLSGRCVDPLLRRFDALFAALVRGGLADPHRLRYSAARKMDRKARKMQRLVASTALLSQELDVLAELEQAAAGLHRSGPGRKGAASGGGGGGGGEGARRVAQQRLEVDRLRAASLWNRTFDYAVRLLARSLFTIVARIARVFGLEPKNVATMDDDDAMISLATTRLSWTNSFVGSVHSLVYPSDFAADTHTPRRLLLDAKSGKLSNGGEHVRRFLLSRNQSLRQLKWPMAGKQLIGCMVSASRSPDRERWINGDGDLALSFSYYMSTSNDDYSSINSQLQDDHTKSNLSSMSLVFESSSHNWVMNAPAATTLGAAALALHYANLIIFIEKLAVAPRHICPDERDALYNMLTDRIRASLRARLRPVAKNMASSSSSACDPAMAAEWSDTVQRILGWLAPLAHNMLRWQSERNFEQRNVASSSTGVLLLQTLHFADQKKSEAAIVELLVGLNYLWRAGRELDAKAKSASYVGRPGHQTKRALSADAAAARPGGGPRRCSTSPNTAAAAISPFVGDGAVILPAAPPPPPSPPGPPRHLAGPGEAGAATSSRAPASTSAAGGSPRGIPARRARLRKGYVRDVRQLRGQYAYEAQLLEAKRQRKAEARAEAALLASEERKAAAEHRAFEEDFLQALMKERGEKLESWREKEKFKADKKAEDRELLRRKSSVWVAENQLEDIILRAIERTTPL